MEEDAGANGDGGTASPDGKEEGVSPVEVGKEEQTQIVEPEKDEDDE